MWASPMPCLQGSSFSKQTFLYLFLFNKLKNLWMKRINPMLKTRNNPKEFQKKRITIKREESQQNQK